MFPAVESKSVISILNNSLQFVQWKKYLIASQQGSDWIGLKTKGESFNGPCFCDSTMTSASSTNSLVLWYSLLMKKRDIWVSGTKDETTRCYKLFALLVLFLFVKNLLFFVSVLQHSATCYLHY